MEERPTNGMSEQPKNDSLSLSIGIKMVFITIQIENIMYKRMFCTNFNFPKYCVVTLKLQTLNRVVDFKYLNI